MRISQRSIDVQIFVFLY